MLRPILLASVVALGSAAEARAGLMIQTPTGLNPGDQFTVMFVTNGTFRATSTNIADYNNDVNSAAIAAGVSYNNSIVTGWRVFGATETANNATALLASTAPVYTLPWVAAGNPASEIATSGTTLLQGPPGPTQNEGPTISEMGNSAAVAPTWTGLNSDGSTATGTALGDTESIAGLPGFFAPTWAHWSAVPSTVGSIHLYGFVTLTVPTTAPEPASITLTLVGLGALVGSRLARRGRGAASTRPAFPQGHS